MMNMGNFQMGANNQVNQNRFSGAQGLGYMPSYYAQPSSVELAMIGAKTPYELAEFNANYGSKMAGFNAQQQQQAILAQWMQQLGMYQPERIQTPSAFDKYAKPIIGAGMAGYGAYTGNPMLMSGGMGNKTPQYGSQPWMYSGNGLMPGVGGD
jgi:hypothetical protein